MVRRGITTFVTAAAMVFTVSSAFAQRGPQGPVGAGTVHIPPGASAKPTPANSLTVAQRIDAQPKLASRLSALLPAGTTLDQAAQGFKNEGQFIAALHVSHNLGIPFDALKGEMTGANPKSLGAAIHDLKPAADASSETRKANASAKDDLKATGN